MNSTAHIVRNTPHDYMHYDYGDVRILGCVFRVGNFSWKEILHGYRLPSLYVSKNGI
jgi:hypothetical protein